MSSPWSPHPPPPRHPPPWWPENEPWPPAGPPRFWRRNARNFFWRVAGLLALLLILSLSGCALMFWLMFDLRPVMMPGMPLLHVWRTGGIFFRLAVPAVLVLGLIGFGLLLRALGRVARPVGELIEAAGRVETGDYTTRVSETGPHEMRALGHAFNAMTARLQTDEAQRRQLLADLSHELRTPLAIIQGNLEGLADGVYPADEAHLAPLVEETHILARLIDDLRTFALAESGALRLQKEPTDLGQLAGDTAASFRAQAETAGIELRLALADDWPLIEVDPARLREVLANLLTNAFRHTPRGGLVEISGAPAPGRVTLTVRDTGAGIAPADLPHIFDRFYKAPESRGMGLGLAIARCLVVAHGGEIIARSAGPDQGATIQMTLPTAAP